MPFYGQDFDRDTKGWSREDRWSYWIALWAYWCGECQGLPNDDEALSRICECPSNAQAYAQAPTQAYAQALPEQCSGSAWARCKTLIFGAKFKLGADGLWHQKRARELYDQAVKALEMASKRGKAGAAVRWGQEQHDAQAMPEHMLKQCREACLSNGSSTSTSEVQKEGVPPPPPKDDLPPPQEPDGNDRGKEADAAKAKRQRDVEVARIVLGYLNQSTGRQFRECSAHLTAITRRLSEVGMDLDGVKKMIDRQVALWTGTPQQEYLQPSTLFRPSNFQGYYDKRNDPLPPADNRSASNTQHPHFIGLDQEGEARRSADRVAYLEAQSRKREQEGDADIRYIETYSPKPNA